MKKTKPNEQLLLMADEACVSVEEMAHSILTDWENYESDDPLITSALKYLFPKLKLGEENVR